jgi:hypothetical protein
MAVLNSKEICKSCRFFSFGDVLGICNRYPQTFNKHENNWCGEYIEDESRISIEFIKPQPIQEIKIKTKGKKK